MTDDLELLGCRGTSCFVSPIRDHAFFEQAQLERLLGNDLFQLLGLALEVLDLAAGRSAGRVAGEPALAGFEELLRPTVVEALGDAFAAAEFGDRVTSPRKPSRTMRIFSSAEYCLRVARRMSLDEPLGR